MICPKCGNMITMQEYRCSVCGLDLNCSTPEGRQKAEAYANHMYASGRWKPRQPVQRITDIPAKKPEPIERITETVSKSEKKKRNPFKIATILLAFVALITTLLFFVMWNAALEKQAERDAAIKERDALRVELESATRIKDAALDYAIDTSIQNANSVSEASALVNAYKREAEADYRAVNEILAIYATVAGTDFPEVKDSVDKAYQTYVNGLDGIDSYGVSNSTTIETIEGIRAHWKNAVNKTYEASESIRK